MNLKMKSLKNTILISILASTIFGKMPLLLMKVPENRFYFLLAGFDAFFVISNHNLHTPFFSLMLKGRSNLHYHCYSLEFCNYMFAYNGIFARECTYWVCMHDCLFICVWAYMCECVCGGLKLVLCVFLNYSANVIKAEPAVKFPILAGLAGQLASRTHHVRLLGAE